jgi:hypothetical protein
MKESDAKDEGKGRVKLQERQYTKKLRGYNVGLGKADSGNKIEDLLDVFERLLLDVDASWRDKKVSDNAKQVIMHRKFIQDSISPIGSSPEASEKFSTLDPVLSGRTPGSPRPLIQI